MKEGRFLDLGMLVVFSLSFVFSADPIIVSGDIDPSSQVKIGEICKVMATARDADGADNLVYLNIAFSKFDEHNLSQSQIYGDTILKYFVSGSKLQIQKASDLSIFDECVLGSADVISNSYIEIDCSKSELLDNGGNQSFLSIAWDTVFKDTFESDDYYMYASSKDKSGTQTDWQRVYNINIESNNTNFCNKLSEEIMAYLNVEDNSNNNCNISNYNPFLDTNKDGIISPMDILIIIQLAGDEEECKARYNNEDPCNTVHGCTDDSDCNDEVTYSCEKHEHDNGFVHYYSCIDKQDYQCDEGKCISDSGYGDCGSCFEGCDGDVCSDISFPKREINDCQDLVNFVASPYSFKDNDDSNSAWILDWQYNWSGREYFGGKDYEFNLYEAHFSYQQQFPYDEFYGWGGYGYRIYDFGNSVIDLDSFLKEMVEKRICEPYTREDSNAITEINVIYVCDNGILWDFDKGEEYRSSYGDIYWTSGKNLIQIDFDYFYNKYDFDWKYYEFYLDEYQKIMYQMENQHEELMKSQGKISSQLNSLFDNKPQYVSPLNVYYFMPWHIERLLARDLSVCPSDLSHKDNDCYPNWQCILEPSVCPEHGYQTRRCEDTNGCFDGKEETQVSCNPGICSGCMMPKDPFWSWGAMDTKCMPYGARFNYELLSGDQTLEGGVMEDEFGTFSVSVNDDYSAVAHVIIPSEDIDETIHLYEDNFAKFNYVQEFSGEPLRVFVEEIIYNENQKGNGYVVIQNIEGYNAYCDYDGNIKKQKLRRPNGDWATCQNNFECESNFCSTGECIEIQDMLSDIGGMREVGIKILCRFADMFGVQRYDRCILENLGEQA